MTIVVVILLCAAGLVYSQGWFDWSSPGMEMESNKVSTDQTIDEENTKEDSVRVTQETAQPVDTARE